MTTTMMACGHAANGTTEDGKPACVVCYGIVPGATTVAIGDLDLSSRKMRCTYGHDPVPSDARGAFFQYRPDMPTDSYYCGCRGWD